MSFAEIAVIRIAVFGGYLLGSINGAQFIHHVLRPFFPRHITRVGTKIAGTQNVWVTIGKYPAIFVLAIDILKGYFAVHIARVFELETPLVLIAGVAAVVGHNWPLFFHFRGGRGVATLIGALFALDVRIAAVIALAGQFFTLIRWSGIMPLAVIAGFAYLGYQSWGTTLIVLMAVAGIIIIARRLHAYWPSFQKSKRKFWVLKNILWYDRPGANPPSLKEVFNLEKI